MIQTTPEIKIISKALIQFHSKMGKIGKDSKNPFFKNKYASLSKILEAIKDPLSECGLVITQHPVDKNKLSTMLLHESGEYFESTYEMTPSKDDPQGQGSTITYQRRYALGAILGLNIDDDDDGNMASKGKPEVKMPQEAPSGKITAQQAVSLIQLAKMNGYAKADLDKQLTVLGYSNTSDILKQDYQTYLDSFSIKKTDKIEKQKEITGDTDFSQYPTDKEKWTE